MDSHTLAVEAVIEADHWWFVGRRQLFSAEIKRLGLDGTAAVADIGTGTGTNLRMLRELGFSRVTGVDMNDEAIRHCASKGLGAVVKGSICNIPLADASQNLVLATDVVEHVDDDALALREIARILAPGGKTLIAVPAFMSLWGLQDEVAHHKRRYRLHQIRQITMQSGLRIRRSYYFNYILFFPIWLARQIISQRGIELKSENEVNTPLLNLMLTAIFKFDCTTAPHLHPPLGVSALIVAERPLPDR